MHAKISKVQKIKMLISGPCENLLVKSKILASKNPIFTILSKLYKDFNLYFGLVFDPASFSFILNLTINKIYAEKKGEWVGHGR